MGPRPRTRVFRGRYVALVAAMGVAGVALAALVGWLLVVNLRAGRQVRESLLRHHEEQAQNRAATISYLVRSARNELHSAGDSRSVSTYLHSRDLGMSEEYGLGLSRDAIRERLRQLTSRDAGHPSTFERVVLHDVDGTVLADSAYAGAPLLDRRPDRADAEPGMHLTEDRRRLVLTQPVLFKGRVAGHIAASLRPEGLPAAFAGRPGAAGDRSAFYLVDDQGRPYASEVPLAPAAAAAAPPAALAVPADGVLREIASPVGGGEERFLASRVPIAGIPFHLVDVDRDTDLVGAVTPEMAAVNASAAALAVLGMVAMVVVLATRSIMLRTRLDESLRMRSEVEAKNRELEAEAAARRRVEASRAVFASALEQTAEAVAIADHEFRVQWANAAMERLAGEGAQRLRGRHVLEVLHSGADLGALTAAMEPALASGHTWESELRGGRGGAAPVEVQVMVSPVRDPSGAVTTYVALARDVTEERREREKRRHLQKLEAIGTLAGGVAHDFNNLITAINGYAGLALESVPRGSPLRDDLEEIRRAGTRAAELTRQLLAFGRRQVMKPDVVDLNAVVSGVERMLRRLIGEDLALETRLHEGLWRARVDRGQVEQVIVNLAVNARDAMPGGGTVRIETRNVTLDEGEAAALPEGAPGDYVLVQVSDTGTGMDAGTAARAFEPFFTTKEPGKGTGLGLSTVYGIVRQSRGFVRLRSTPGVGTVVDVYLPRHEGAGQADAPLRARPAPGPAACSGTVLVAEDEEQVRRLLASRLGAEGFQVLAASDGREALEVAGRHEGRIDVLLSDVVMPRLSGPDLARGLRAIHPETAVVFLTGHAEEAVERQGKMDGAAAFFEKPPDLDDLAATLRRLVAEGRPA